MIRSPDEPERMPKAMPIRMRTFLVPLSGAALYYVVILSVSAVSSVILGKDFIRFQNTVRAVAIILLLAAIFLWLRIYRIFEEETIMQDAVSVGKILSVGIIALGLLGLTMLYFYLVEKILSSIPAVRESVEEYKQWVEASPESLLEKIMYAVTLTLLVPIAEELIFRGIILQEFLSTMKPIIAVLLASAFFGLIHLQPIQIIYAFFCGAVISTVYVLSRSIYLSIILHGIYNFFGSVLPTIAPTGRTVANILTYVYLGSIAFSVIAMLYLKRSKRGNSWTEVSDASSYDGKNS